MRAKLNLFKCYINAPKTNKKIEILNVLKRNLGKIIYISNKSNRIYILLILKSLAKQVEKIF